MKLSEYIAKLQNKIAIVGDVDVFSERRNETYGDIDEFSYTDPPIVFTTTVRRRSDNWTVDHTIAVVK